MRARHECEEVWLDLTRLLSRIGRGAATGIDRVELAYLNHFSRHDPARFLCRTSRGYLLLGANGAHRLATMLGEAAPLDRADLISRLIGKGDNPRHKAEAVIRRLAIDRCLPHRLPALLARHVSREMVYLNVGHSNLTEQCLGAFHKHPGAQTLVLIHDLIPITHPQFTSPGLPGTFAARIEAVRRFASLVIANSEVTADDLREHWRSSPERPPIVKAALGVDLAAAPQSLPRDPDHFVMLGTIEPRKNHSLMIDVWELIAEETAPERMPKLHIIGHKGWNVDALMERLNTHPLLNQSIFLHGPLPDHELADHLARTNALLFPSFVEGYGLPPLEAAAAGAVPVCADLPIFHETLGKSAVFVKRNDASLWSETIKLLQETKNKRLALAPLITPTWGEHFDRVQTALEQHREGTSL